ncbi:SH3 domain-containing protein 3 [Vitis vinifera]|uniref:SH3 domain-containing protein 3 n=1 Tax=Vitis vinifera TaxID=29760 RepID=A0A438JPI6_VITVI|nr:SH3 domain-containing protein 3 [Vitis vinifera]
MNWRISVFFVPYRSILFGCYKQFGGTGYESSDVMVIDEVEMQRHQQLEKLYRSTRAGKVEMV